MINETTLGEVDETVRMEVGIAVVHEGQIGHVQTTKREGERRGR